MLDRRRAKRGGGGEVGEFWLVGAKKSVRRLRGRFMRNMVGRTERRNE